jgi:hypothetical protein
MQLEIIIYLYNKLRLISYKLADFIFFSQLLVDKPQSYMNGYYIIDGEQAAI